VVVTRYAYVTSTAFIIVAIGSTYTLPQLTTSSKIQVEDLIKARQ